MELLQKSETSCGKKSEDSAKWECIREAMLAFQKSRRIFPEAAILQHIDPAKPIIRQQNSTRFTIAGYLNQYDVFGVLMPVKFCSRKSSAAE